ncbi:hypothetical protein RR46_11371 [Papilio xuthus]|uniref:Uncharacterized protein n=1 Tax=Papilio xuthus TaxID=66420 RepID=A0A194PRT0_PAPXU|nr:hypothetical protein RR46_11371 [Papilio xuthus]
MPNKRHGRRQSRSLSRNRRSHSSQHDSRYRRRSPSSNILTETMQQILNRLVSLVSSSQRKSSGRAAVEVAKSAVPVATISVEPVPAVEPAVSMPPPSQLGEAVTASSLQGRFKGFNDSVLTGASRERYGLEPQNFGTNG